MSKQVRSKVRSKASGSGRTEAKKDLLVQAIASWAREEVKFEEKFIPGAEELKLLLKDSSSVRMWDHLVTCVHSPSNTDLARKNLQLHLGDRDNREARLHARRLECDREAASLELALAHMETEISRLQTDIGSLARKNKVLKQQVGGASKRRTLLSAHCIKLQEMAELVREYTRRIASRKECFCWPDQETSYFTRGGIGSGKVELESACKRDVREACGLVKELLGALAIEDQQSSNDGNNVAKAKAQVWSRAESLLSAHPPASLLDCLCCVTKDEALSLHRTTAALNLKEDAARLRCGLDQSIGDDSSSTRKSSFLQSVEDHLMEAQMSHIQECLKCERSKGAGRYLQRELEEVREDIEGLLWKQLPNQAERELLRGVVFQRLEESGCEAMLAMLTWFCESLESGKARRSKELWALQEKRDRIDKFAGITEVKQSQIRKLAKLNSAARQRMLQQRSELEVYVRKSVCGHEGQLLSLGSGLVGSGTVELDLFSLLDLRCLLKTPGLRSPSHELSIHRQQPHHAEWEQLLTALQLPPYTSPSVVLRHLSSCLEEVEAKSMDTRHQRHLLHKMKQSTSNADDCQGVVQASQDYDQRLSTTGVEAANQSMLLASQALARCSVVQDTLQQWWEEPSQKSIPWVTHEGMSLSNWLEQWKVLTAKLKQLEQP